MDAIEATYGPGSGGDSVLTRLARLQQAWYRVEVLKITECGTSPDSGKPLQSYLPPGRERDNFVSTEAYHYAKRRLADKSNPDGRGLTIAEARLKFNMLSSQPMCFNLFADLRAAVARQDPMATAVIAAMFPEASIAHADAVVIEDVPYPTSDYIGDKTGWDASIRANDGTVLVTIETKYTDRIDTGRPKRDNPTILAIASDSGVFTDEGLAYYEMLGGLDQLGRNLLLTAVYARRHSVASATNYVLAPAFDQQAATLVDAMRTRLTEKYAASIQFRTLDAIVDAALPLATGPVADALTAFRTRYLDLSPARTLLGTT